LSYNGVSTGCLNWDASSDTVRAAILANIPAIDDVYIERSGTGTSASAYGYVYSVYFTGNYVHTRSGSSSNPLPMLMAHTNTTACASNSCANSYLIGCANWNSYGRGIFERKYFVYRHPIADYYLPMAVVHFTN
jgi:hypothetical protein